MIRQVSLPEIRTRKCMRTLLDTARLERAMMLNTYRALHYKLMYHAKTQVCKNCSDANFQVETFGITLQFTSRDPACLLKQPASCSCFFNKD